MNKVRLLFLSLFIIGQMSTQTLLGQNAGDFRSAQSGTWGTLTTWETYNGATWVAASSIPDSALAPVTKVTTIRSPHNVTVDATIGVRNVIVDPGATVTVNGTPVVLYIATEGMTVNGTLTLVGDVATAAPFTITKTTGILTIGATGVVNYNQTAASTSTKGALPNATWLTGSTLNVITTGGATCSNWGAGSAQDFYNINWNFPAQSANFGFGLVGSTVGGTINIISTGTGRFMFFGGTGGGCRVNGDFIVSGSASATIMGSSSGTSDTVSIYGKVNVNTTGNFSITRGSQGSGTGTSIWYFYGDSIKMKAKVMQNSNSGTDVTKFIFKKSGTQYLSIIPDTVSGNATPIEVSTGTTLTLASPVNCTRLYLNGGIIISSSTNPLIMGWGSIYTGTLSSGSVSPTAPGSSSSYVSGPMTYLYATAAGVTTKPYPIGKGGIYRPVSLSFTQTAATLSAYTAEMFNSAPPANTLPGTLDKVSSIRYYSFTEAGGGSAFTAGSIILSYDTDDLVGDASALRIAESDGAGNWTNLGGTGSANITGTISSSVPFTTLGNFVLAKQGRELNIKALIEGFYDGSTMVSDTATVELHNVTSPFALVESQKRVLSTAGAGTFTFTTAVNGTNYYIAVKHRNAVETWSGTGHSFSSSTLSYDFTTSQSQAYGSNMTFKGTKWCMFSGDVNHDGIVDSGDLGTVDNDNANYVSGYTDTDVNGDGIVDSGDLGIVDNNNANYVGKVTPGGANTAVRSNRQLVK
jgi:hypothetical protein